MCDIDVQQPLECTAVCFISSAVALAGKVMLSRMMCLRYLQSSEAETSETQPKEEELRPASTHHGNRLWVMMMSILVFLRAFLGG
jgi:hypothetical protein